MKLPIAIAAMLLIGAASAGAKVVDITEWNVGLPGRGEEQQPETSCAMACSGYDLTTLICPEGQVLEDCPAQGCSYYHRCVNE